MKTPILIIKGEAGSGKDAVTDFLVKNHGYAAIAQADPMKRLAARGFGFTEEQLWGPSSCRNAMDPRFTSELSWEKTEETLFHNEDGQTKDWLADLGLMEFETYMFLKAWYHRLHDLQSCKAPPALSPRICLQSLGTEFGRHVDRDVWSRYALRVGEKLLTGGYKYNRSEGLIKDTSFPGYRAVVTSDGRFRNEIFNVLKANGSSLNLINPVDESAAVEAGGIPGHASESEAKGIPASWFTYTLVNDKSQGLNWLEKRVAVLNSQINDQFRVEI